MICIDPNKNWFFIWNLGKYMEWKDVLNCDKLFYSEAWLNEMWKNVVQDNIQLFIKVSILKGLQNLIMSPMQCEIEYISSSQ